MSSRLRGPATLIALLVLAACTTSPTPSQPGAPLAGPEAGADAPLKRATIVVANESPIPYYPLAPPATRGGAWLIFAQTWDAK